MRFKSFLSIPKIYLICILIILGANDWLHAQSDKSFQLKGKTELAAAFSFQSIKQKNAGSGSWIFTLPLQARYYVTQHIGLGGEVTLTDSKGEKNTGYVLNGIVEAAFPTPSGSILFLDAGYGISNGSFLLDRLAIKNYDNVTLGVLNLGVGIRIPFAEKVFGNIELRYQKYSGEYNYNSIYPGYFQTIDLSTNYVNVLFGFSLLL